MSQNAYNRSVALSAVILAGLGSLPAFGSSSNASHSLNGSFAFRMTPAKSFSADAPNDPGGIAKAPRQDVLRVGVFTADGAGNLAGHTLATTDTVDGQTWLVEFDWAGKYLVNANGTGYFSVDTLTNMVCTDMTVAHTGPTPHPATAGGTPLAGNIACPTGTAAIEGHEDYGFVFSTPGGKEFQFIETDNDGGGAKIFMTGTATKQQEEEAVNPNSNSNGHH
jgi:hypothetical protein